MYQPRSFVAFASIILVASTLTHAQCGHAGWQEGWNAPGIALSSEIYPDCVRAMTVWDPDGTGPQEELLVLGGSFIAAGHLSVKNIVAWNGRTFVEMGSGLGGPVYALETTENGTLVAGGAFGTRGDGAAGYDPAAYFPCPIIACDTGC